MKLRLHNTFHNKEAVIAIKDKYCCAKFGDTFDPIQELQFEIYNDGRDAKYAKRKYNEIKKKVCCGSNSDCSCIISVWLRSHILIEEIIGNNEMKG